MPPKNILIQLYLNQQNFSSQQELEYIRDVVLQETDAYKICKMLIEQTNIDGMSNKTDLENKHNVFLMNVMEQSQIELEAFFEQFEDQLLKIFQ